MGRFCGRVRAGVVGYENQTVGGLFLEEVRTPFIHFVEKKLCHTKVGYVYIRSSIPLVKVFRILCVA